MSNALATSQIRHVREAWRLIGQQLTERMTPKRVLIASLLLTGVVYWAAIPFVNLGVTRGHVIGSDGLFYYEYLPSFFLDGDLDFGNQRRALIADGVPYNWGALHPSAGNVTHFAPGWAVLVAPFFLAAHALATALAWFQPMRLDGYGFLHESITNFGAVAYGCAGVFFVFQTLRRWFDERLAVWTALATLGATNLAYYVVAQASMAHAAGFFCVAGALYHVCVLTQGPASRRHAWAFGLLSGLAFIVRPQLALCALMLFTYAAFLRVPLRALLTAAAAACAVSLIQLGVWYVLFDQAIVVPQGRGFLRLSQPMVVELLFSLRHGLFSWHPFYLLCCLGLLFGPVGAGLRVLAIAVIALQVYVNASVYDWWAGHAFGQRRLIDVLPFFALGGASLLQRLSRSLPVAPLLAGLIGWNLLFMIQYRFGYIPRGEGITWQQLVTDKFRLVSLPRRF